MKMNYRIAESKDIDLLVFRRAAFCEYMKKQPLNGALNENLYAYFQKSLSSGSCIAILAEDNQKCIGTGIVFFYDSVPSPFNVTGKNAYITSIFVDEHYRNSGVATKILKDLISESVSRGYKKFYLSASDAGKPLYTKLGFQELSGNMMLDMDNFIN